MKALSLAVLATALCLSACERPAPAAAATDAFGSIGSDGHARFSGAGIYPTSRMWEQIVGVEASKSPAASRLKDDSQIIVVVDTRTGEIRQCGNMSGVCVGMNPWSKPLTPAQSAPVPVLKHEEDFQREADEANAKAEATLKAETAKARAKARAAHKSG